MEGGPGEPEEKHVAVTLAKKSMGYNSWDALLETDKADLSITDRCVGMCDEVGISSTSK